MSKIPSKVPLSKYTPEMLAARKVRQAASRQAEARKRAEPPPPAPTEHLTEMQLLTYALEGVQMLIGSHPEPLNFPDEIAEYEDHRAEIEKRIELLRPAA